MQLTLAVIVLCACVAVTLQQAPSGPTGPGGSSPLDRDVGDDSGIAGPTRATDALGPRAPGSQRPGKEDEDGDDEWKDWNPERKPEEEDSSKSEEEDSSKSEEDSSKSEEEDDDKKDSKPTMGGGSKPMMGGGSMPMMSGSKPAPPPSGIHMKFEFDMGAAMMAGKPAQGRDMGRKEDSSSRMDGDNGGKNSGKMAGNMGGMMGGKTDGKTGGMMGGKSDGKTGGMMGGKTDGKTGGMMGGKDVDIKKHMARPHRPILCRVNASGEVVSRKCPFHLICGGGKGIKQGNWIMYFCRKDATKRSVTEYDYPDESEFYKSEKKDGDKMDDKDVVDGYDG